MENENIVPELRFSEFKNALKISKLGEIADITKLAGYEYTKHIVYSKTGKIIGLRALNIKNNEISTEDVQYIDKSDFSKLSRSKLFIDDLLFTYIGANIGDIAVVPENDKYYLAPNISRIRCDEVNSHSHFIFQYFRRNKFRNKEISKYVASSSQPALAMENIRKFRITLPDILEQKKIASFLTAIDKRKNLLEEKKIKLERYKKGVMQQLFNQDIRFKDNDGNSFPDWEEKWLGEVCTKQSSNISANSIQDNDGDYKIYGASGYLQNIDFYREEEAYISIVKDGAGVGRILLCEPKSSVLGTLEIIKPKDDNHLGFLFALLSQIRFTKYITGSTIPHIYFKDYSKEKVDIPHPDEQKKIADFLSYIDESINKISMLIDKTIDFKKGLLQKMFV
jgi:type I restriction enzyme S subunit